MSSSRPPLQRVITDRESTWKLVPSNSAGNLALILAKKYPDSYNTDAFTACIQDIKSFATSDEKLFLVNDIESKAKEPLQILDWVTLYLPYDLIVMSVNPLSGIDLNNLDYLFRKNHQMPFLINRGGQISLYRRFAHGWVKIDLDPKAFAQLEFPEIGKTSVLKNAEITKEMHQEIVIKEGKPYYKGESKYLDVPTLLPLSQVLPLVWRALKDHPQYAHASNAESPELRLQQASAQFGDRLANFFSTLHRVQTGICHHGVRNELLYLLHGSYSLDGIHPVLLIADAELVVMAWIRDTIAKAYAKASQDANAKTKKQFEQALLTWMREVTPHAPLSMLGNEDEIRNNLIQFFLSHALNPEIETIKTPINNMLLGLSFGYSQEHYPKGLEYVNNLFNAVEQSDSVYKRGLNSIIKWIDAEYESANEAHEKRVMEVDCVYQIYIRIQKHETYLSVTAGELMLSVLKQCQAYFSQIAENRYPILSVEFRDQIKQLNKIIDDFIKDNMKPHIENFFKNYFIARSEKNIANLRLLYNLLTNDKTQSKMILDDDGVLLKKIKKCIDERRTELDLSPYEFNQLFLHAIIIEPAQWTPLFATAFQSALAYVKGELAQTTQSTNAVRFNGDRAMIRGSYPQTLIEQFEYHQYQYLDHSRREGAPPVAVRNRRISIPLPRHAEDSAEVVRILEHFDAPAQVDFYQRNHRELDLAINKLVTFTDDQFTAAAANTFLSLLRTNPRIFIKYITNNVAKIVKNVKLFTWLSRFIYRNGESSLGLSADEIYDLLIDLFRRSAAGGMDVTYSTGQKHESALNHLINFFNKDDFHYELIRPLFLTTLVTILGEHHANFNVVNAIGMTPVHNVAMSTKLNDDDKIKLLRILLKFGADLFVRDNARKRAIGYTSSNVYVAIWQMMMDQLSVPECIDSFENVLLALEFRDVTEKIKIYKNHQLIIDSFIPKQLSSLALLPVVIAKEFFYAHCGAITTDIGEISSVLDDLRNRLDDDTVLDSTYDLTIYKKCVDAGLNANSRFEDSSTLMHVAAYHDHAELVSSLHQHGANIHAVDSRGQTPLHIAAAHGHSAVMSMLVTQGANLNAIDNAGNTPAHVAVQNGMDAVELLRSRGADFTIRNNAGETADVKLIKKMTSNLDITSKRALAIISLVTRETNPLTANAALVVAQNNNLGLFSAASSTSSTRTTEQVIDLNSITELAAKFEYWIKHNLESHEKAGHDNHRARALLNFLSQLHCVDYISTYDQFMQLAVKCRVQFQLVDMTSPIKHLFYDYLELPPNDDNLGHLLSSTQVSDWPPLNAIKKKITHLNQLFKTLALLSMQKGLHLLDHLGNGYLEKLLLQDSKLDESLTAMEAYRLRNIYTIAMIALLRAYKSQFVRVARFSTVDSSRLFTGQNRITVRAARTCFERDILEGRFHFQPLTTQSPVAMAMSTGNLGKMRQAFTLHGRIETIEKMIELPENKLALVIRASSKDVASSVIRIQELNGDLIRNISISANIKFIEALPNGQLLLISDRGDITVIDPYHSSRELARTVSADYACDVNIARVIVLHENSIAIISHPNTLTLYHLSATKLSMKRSMMYREMNIDDDILGLKNGYLVFASNRDKSCPFIILDTNFDFVCRRPDLDGRMIELPNHRIAFYSTNKLTIYDVQTNTIMRTIRLADSQYKRVIAVLPQGLAIWTESNLPLDAAERSHSIAIYNPTTGDLLSEFHTNQSVQFPIQLRELIREMKPEYFGTTYQMNNNALVGREVGYVVR